MGSLYMPLGLAVINGRRIDSSLDPYSYETIFKVDISLASMSHTDMQSYC